METPQRTQSQRVGGSPAGWLGEHLADAMRFWEPRRLIYNGVLCTVVIVWLVASWPHFRPAFTLFSLLRLSILALLANICYCAAYLVDIPMQDSALGRNLSHRRWWLWFIGTLLAILVENYWIADEIYPFVS